MPTPDQLALWAAIRANPLDDTPRLVYADWLQENGDEARAEFIRVQIEQNEMFSPTALCADPTERKLKSREIVLLRRHRDSWLRPLFEVFQAADPDFNWKWLHNEVRFFRGFPNRVRLSLRSARQLTNLDSAIEPLSDVKIFAMLYGWEAEAREIVATIAAWPDSGCIRELNLRDVTDEFVEAMANGFLGKLEMIDFHTGDIGDVGAMLLANWVHGASIKELDLFENRIGDAGAAALADSPHLAGLRQLDLRRNPIGPAGQRRLVARFGAAVLLPDD